MVKVSAPGPTRGESGGFRISGLDAIRFTAALWVTFSHLGFGPRWIAGPYARAIGAVQANMFNGVAAVIVFFVISGFCIHWPNRRSREIVWASYFTRRYIRIIPPLAVVLAVSSALHLGIGLFNDIIMWSLVSEIIYYTIYPLLYRVGRSMGWRLLTVLAFVIAVGIVATRPAQLGYHSYGDALNWAVALPCWLLGCCLADNTDWQTFEAPSQLSMWIWRFGVWAASCLAHVMRFHTPIGFPWTLTIFALLVYVWLKQELAYSLTHVASHPMERLGRWTYSLYLTHLMTAALLERSGLLPANKAASWLVVLSVVVLAAFGYYLLIEQPSHRLSRRLGRFVYEQAASSPRTPL